MASLLAPAATLALAVALGVPAMAQAPHCTSDALSVEGAPVFARFCAEPGGDATAVSVVETFASRGKTISRTITLAVVAGARTSRTIDDADLASLGIARTLHMTLAYRGGAVTLEHALALPGAAPVK